MNVINFSIAKVSTEQFAIIEDAFEQTAPITLNTNLRFAIDKENRMIAVYTLFKFEQNESPFILIEVACHFVVDSDSWKNFAKEDGTVVAPRDFMTHLGMITVGTTRGVLHTKSEGTKFNHFVIPTINVHDIITGDVTFA
ncbi:MAG: hypothetical protein ACK5UP_00410 [Bacteroidota bacterium]|jgi:hypothetical protein|nr:hypothetical protein [Cytophagales bacterium]MCA6430480.1 hypothetical protein [Cytophagales bacterium]MCE2956356.1 hypothetical protein [Flammeovirgaceae bacterium]MCZ8071244.1 hypothetical protein [Cytophagales bacterium]